MRPSISDEEARSFLDNGYVILRGALEGNELGRVRAAMDELTTYGSGEVRLDPDYKYGAGASGEKILRRIEYVIDKRPEMRVLLANPFILRSTQELMGSDLIPTWDAMVLKMPKQGVSVPWHRDAGAGSLGDKPIFNVDFYLDEADQDTCVWLLPGSATWDGERVSRWISEHRGDDTADQYRASGAVPALMRPGDVMLHNILVLHGSPRNISTKLRRVVYYEFRTAHVEHALGPHTPAYVPLKQRLLLACIELRKAADWVPSDELPFVYDPPPPFDLASLAGLGPPSTFRVVHEEYWRQKET